MEKDTLNVDNPLLLTSLYGKGVFLVSAPLNNNQTMVSNSSISENPSEISAKNNSTEAEKSAVIVNSHTTDSTSTLSIPNVDVLHIVVETGESSYREVVIPNTMNALTKIQCKWGRTYEIIDASKLPISPKQYIDRVPNQVKIVFWGKDTSFSEGLSENSHRLLLLNMPSVMLASQESKTEHWNRIKWFFGQ